jgi:hypothetical protein
MKIIPSYFLITVFLTMLVLYLMYPEPQIVIKYPNPNDPVSDVYVDENDVCYRYYRNEIDPK